MSLPVQALAREGYLINIDWQLPGGWNAPQKPFIRFRAQVSQTQGHHLPQKDKSFSGDISITGRAGQQFIVCSQQVVTDDFIQVSTMAESDYSHTLLLKDTVGELTIMDGKTCPDGLSHQYFYDMQKLVRSTEPFLVTRKEKSGSPRHKNCPLSALPFPPFEQKGTSLVSLGGGSLGFDDHGDFKRPPFMPALDKMSFGLILLPTLNLPANWREHLPFVGLYHWLTDTEHEGVTIILRFNNQHPTTLRISHAELPELAEHLLSARQLLYWLTYKLNGREQLVEQLLRLSEDSAIQPNLLSAESLDAIQKQLAIVMEQPDTEFNLEFETHLLADSLSVSSLVASPEAGIIQCPKGKTSDEPKPSPEETKQSPQKEQPTRRQSGQERRNSQENNGKGGRPQKQPPGRPSASNSEEHIIEDYFVIVVNDIRFHIRKEQLLPSQRGQEKASAIRACNPDNPAESLPLNEVEAIADIPEHLRLSKYGNRALGYLLTYGIRATKKALLHHYPTHLISEQEGHLVAVTNYREFPVDAVCEVCQEPLLSRQSLTHCAHPGKHTFHTSCLSQWLRRSQSETRCPYCHGNLSFPLSMQLSKELESELFHAVEMGNRAVVEALVETGVNIDARNADGNTPLWLACSQHQYEMIELLLEKMADIHQTGFEGMSVLDAAVLTAPRRRSPDAVINLLLEKNVMLTERGAAGIDDIVNTPLRHVLMNRYQHSRRSAAILVSERQDSQRQGQSLLRQEERLSGHNKKHPIGKTADFASYYRDACLRYQRTPFENSRSEFEFNIPLAEWGSFCEKNRDVRRQQHYRVERYIPIHQVADLPGSFSCRISSDQAPGSFVQVYIIKESVTHFECDAVVNAANESLLGGGGVDHAIHQGAGPNLVKECAFLNGCEVGEAKITKGYDLAAKYVLHTVAPILSKSGTPDEVALESCYQSCFKLCDQYQLRSIAIPCIGCGFYGFPLDKSAAVVKKVLQEYVDSAEGLPSIKTVVLSVFTDEQFETYRRAFK